jgi:hypothetical protein
MEAHAVTARLARSNGTIGFMSVGFSGFDELRAMPSQ